MITLQLPDKLPPPSPEVFAAAEAIRSRGREAGAEMRRLEAEQERCLDELRRALGPRPAPSLLNPLALMFYITGN